MQQIPPAVPGALLTVCASSPSARYLPRWGSCAWSYLVAADLRIGRHDPLTHLKVFTVDEVERIAARLGLPPPRLEEQLAEESAPADNALLGRLPEPAGE